MDGKRLIQTLKIKNLLSFGSEGVDIELQPLNVLIGPNASGKSNLIEIIGLLHALPRDLATPVREGGGISEWLWKGNKNVVLAELKVDMGYKQNALRHLFRFSEARNALEIVDEYIYYAKLRSKETKIADLIENDQIDNVSDLDADEIVYLNDSVIAYIKLTQLEKIEVRDHRQSIISQRRDPDFYPEITYLANLYDNIHIYQYFDLAPSSVLRDAQLTDLPNDFLRENGDNLVLILNDLQNRPEAWQHLMKNLQKFYDTLNFIATTVQAGRMQIFVHEKGLKQPISVRRLSDGTLRYLCLLAILCHPEPPPLICIEEPELGMHPDMMPTIAELLIEASQRTQLIVTTHSTELVSALSSVPEAVIVCERGKEGTQMRRLEPKPLKEWLQKYSLGELWQMGEIGGTRW